MITRENVKEIGDLGARIFQFLGLVVTVAFTVSTYKSVRAVALRQDEFDTRLTLREAVAKEYVPRVEAAELSTKNLSGRVDDLSDLVTRVLDRQKEMRDMLENRMPKKTKPKRLLPGQ